MNARVAVTVDGRQMEVSGGTTLLQAITTAGIETPTLCYQQHLRAVNACRVCVVELKGSRVLVPACSRVAEDGMELWTDTPRVRLARRLVLELLGSSVDTSTAPGLQRHAARYGAQADRFGEGVATVAQPVHDDNALYVRDYSKCILCYACTSACGSDVQSTFAIGVAGRGFGAHIDTGFDAPLGDSPCVYCGNCVAVCPTGALMGRTEWLMRQEGAWHEEEQKSVDTTCPYCGVGCALRLHVQDNRIVKVSSPREHSVTRGFLCVKGRFGYEFVQARRGRPQDTTPAGAGDASNA
jgi:predicted molibdopterin-dependent oxidoreductase YjgC